MSVDVRKRVEQVVHARLDSPLVTVVIPTYNRRGLVEQAIESVLSQTYSNWELIVVDDGSTDGTAAYVRALPDTPVRLVELAHTGCVGRLRNAGATTGSGELVAFLDSDDVWLPRKLELQVSQMIESGARWCYGGFELMDTECRAIPLRAGASRAVSGRIVRELLTMDVGACTSSLITERSLFEELGGFREDPLALAPEDYELDLRLALRADATAVAETVVRVREHPGRSTNGLDGPFERSARVYDLFLELGPPDDLARLARAMRSRHLADAAADRLIRGEDAAARALFARALQGAADPGWWVRALARGLRGRLRRSLRR